MYTGGSTVSEADLGRMVVVKPRMANDQLTLPKPSAGRRLTVVNYSTTFAVTLVAPGFVNTQYAWGTTLSASLPPCGSTILEADGTAWCTVGSSDAASLNGHAAADFLPVAGGTLSGKLAGTTATFNSVAAQTFTGSLAGNAATATSASSAASALTAVKLATPRLINGVSFDGSANVTLDAKALGYTASITPNGYEKSPTGRITQWGMATSAGTSSSGNVVITLPTPFVDDVYSATANVVTNNGNFAVYVTSSTATQLVLTTVKNGARASGVQVCWHTEGR